MAKGINKLKGPIQNLLQNNFLVNSRNQKLRLKYINAEFLASDGFETISTEHISNKEEFKSYLDDAEKKTDNFKHRHLKFGKVLGCWRWKGLYVYRDRIIDLVFDSNKRGIDFGGANGPVSMEIDIVDFAEKDVFGKKVKYNSLESLDFAPDFIFSSHTLEHIPNLDEVLGELAKTIKSGGEIVFQVPAYSCERWRNGVHTNRQFNDHHWTFYLEGTDLPEGLSKPLAIDTAIKKHFEVSKAVYTGDNSIIIFGKKNG